MLGCTLERTNEPQYLCLFSETVVCDPNSVPAAVRAAAAAAAAAASHWVYGSKGVSHFSKSTLEGMQVVEGETELLSLPYTLLSNATAMQKDGGIVFVVPIAVGETVILLIPHLHTY